MSDLAAAACCCFVDESQPNNCDEWNSCAPESMTITVSFVERVTRIIGGCSSSPFIEYEFSGSYSATLTKDAENFRLAGPIVGSWSTRGDLIDFTGLCPGNTFCPSCGNCCNAIQLAGQLLRSGRIDGEASIACAGGFGSFVSTGVLVTPIGSIESCENVSATCPVDPCDITTEGSPLIPFPSVTAGWNGCADSQNGISEWTSSNSYSTTNSYEEPPIGAPNDQSFYCYDPYAVTDTNPFGIICACLGIAPDGPVDFPFTVFSCPQTIIQESSFVVTIS